LPCLPGIQRDDFSAKSNTDKEDIMVKCCPICDEVDPEPVEVECAVCGCKFDLQYYEPYWGECPKCGMPHQIEDRGKHSNPVIHWKEDSVFCICCGNWNDGGDSNIFSRRFPYVGYCDRCLKELGYNSTAVVADSEVAMFLAGEASMKMKLINELVVGRVLVERMREEILKDSLLRNK
jgi:hypothetical protein